MADRRCLVSICTNWPYVPVQTAQSLMELGWGDRVQRAKDAHGFSEVSFMWARSFPRVDALRDSSAELAVAEGFTHLLFLDADNVWPTDTLMRMLAHHDKGIVGGLYVMRHEPYAPVALTHGFKPSESTVTQYWHDEQAVGATDLRPVDVLGMGCTLIPVEVFRAIGRRPWFEYANDDDGWPRVTEDVPFCQKARAAGYGLWLDPTIICGHVNQMITDVRWALRYQRAQQNTLDRMPFTIKTLQKNAEPSEIPMGVPV